MIISHKYKYIFLKTNKTAGTSIEIALSKHCGPQDIITPISPEDEETRQKLGFPGPQNYQLPTSHQASEGRHLKYYNHISAKEVRAHIGDDIWNSYFKFCFERNPWDRMISGYYWRCQTEPRPSISEFMQSDYPMLLKKRGIGLYTIDGKIAVNRICRFENLQQEMETVRTALGIPEELQLPRAKSRFRKDKRPYQEVLNDAERDFVSGLFKDEIKLLGYKF